MARPLRREDYTVGWVCALPVELAAAQEMFDEEHPDLQHDATDNDENLYALGSISGHNVVIVCLPAGRIGNNPAAAVATQMRATFKQIRFGLMVGIGGGVPNASAEADVRLGDVVVSQPLGKFAGVVQYDSGKSTPSGFERTGALNSPPQMLLSAVAKVRANEMRGRSKLGDHIKKLGKISKFQRSKAGPDILFEAAYKHDGAQTCEKCSPNRHEARESRDSEEEVVLHYGTIASGNQVIKDATVRDNLSAELGGVLCFEMEAAGLMNSFPCLIVRGICDYADSHKNKKWQPYAAATAAAYAKEVLSAIPPADVAKARTAEETIRDASAESTCCIPFLRNRRFVGRRYELAKLKQRLFVDQDCQKMTILGLGGTGKTQIALQFAYVVKEAQPERSIFWVPAVSMETFEKACVDIAEALGISQKTINEEDPKELVQQWLSSSRAGSWLLIVDNADDRDICLGTEERKGIVDYLPQSESGAVVYTTRTPEMTDLTPGDVIELVEMDREDARSFLTKSLNRKDLLSDDVASIKLLDELLDELTCLPLAIAQAAAYLNKNRMPISKYLHLLQNTEQDLVSVMSKEFRDDTRYKGSGNAVATTWVVSFSQIRKYDTVAADLLEFISCVEWKAIPRSLLPCVESEAEMEEAIGTLCGYSFLVRRGGDSDRTKEEGGGTTNTFDDDLFDIHRLVHLATRIWIKEYRDPKEVTGEAIRHLEDAFPSDDHANRYTWRAYLPHALRLLGASWDCDVNEKSALCIWVGRCLQVDGRIREAVAWLEESCRLRSMLDEDDPDLLFAQHVLATAYEADGQTKQSLKLLEAIVKAEETLDASDPSRLASQHALATAYEADGQVKKAVELLETVVKARETLQADHPSRLASQHELARSYDADGQVQKAIELLEVVVEVESKVLDAEHPDRLTSQHNLADGYRRNGQLEDAIELFEHVVAVKAKYYRKDDPLRLLSQHSLAITYEANGQLEEGIKLLEHVVAIKAEALRDVRDDRFSRLVSVKALANMYADLLNSKSASAKEGLRNKREQQLERIIQLWEQAVAMEAGTLQEDDAQRLDSIRILELWRAELVIKTASTPSSASLESSVIAEAELDNLVVAIQAEALEEENPERLHSTEAPSNHHAEPAINTAPIPSSASLESTMVATAQDPPPRRSWRARLHIGKRKQDKATVRQKP